MTVADSMPARFDVFLVGLGADDGGGTCFFLSPLFVSENELFVGFRLASRRVVVIRERGRSKVFLTLFEKDICENGENVRIDVKTCEFDKNGLKCRE